MSCEGLFQIVSVLFFRISVPLSSSLSDVIAAFAVAVAKAFLVVTIILYVPRRAGVIFTCSPPTSFRLGGPVGWCPLPD